jgi:hypothetical protein
MCGLAMLPAGSVFGQPGQGPGPKGPPGVGRYWSPLERWYRMPPEQRERALSRLPPERQRMIRERLERFNSLPPRRRMMLLGRYRYFSHLPPGRQEVLRRDLQRFREIPPDRRGGMTREIEELRAMTEAERRARAASGEFRSRYSPEERSMLLDLAENLPPRN